MAAPEYVPRPKDEKARVYESPPWRNEPWTAHRPSDLFEGQPTGPRLGSPGPDQGYVYKLARTFEGKLTLSRDEHQEDVLAGACALALKRASLFGRAPVIHDLTIALTIFGYLHEGGPPDAELIRFRRSLFEGCAGLHHYTDVRRIVDAVPASVLRLSPAEVVEHAQGNGWRDLVESAAQTGR